MSEINRLTPVQAREKIAVLAPRIERMKAMLDAAVQRGDHDTARTVADNLRYAQDALRVFQEGIE